MRMLFLLLLMVVAPIVTLAALNWPLIVAPQNVSIGFMMVQMPLGLVLLALLGLVSLVFLAYVIYLQGSALLDARRLTKDVQASRDLADKAEASRFTELRNFIGETLRGQHEQVLARLGQMEHSTHTLTEQTGNALAASIGELEDRLERQLVALPRP